MKVLLLVDDVPANNAAVQKAAEDAGVKVHIALTTSEAITKLEDILQDIQNINLRIITDMHRVEQGVEVPDAGAKLIRELSRLCCSCPVLLFCGPYTKNKFSQLYPGLKATVTTDEAEAKNFGMFGY
ncbi:hypothetical protein HDU98_006649 [Podochytrium sp. JEL0797]|nr:hypothetical protein HDU98_006649 [Podochytrium sp. JEL0797]